jgi:transposase
VRVTPSSNPLPTDLAAAHEMIVAQREMLRLAQSELTVSRLEIERYKLMLAKARREQYGQSSERARHLIEQLELAIEDLEETQAAEEAKLEMTAPNGVKEKQARAPRQPRRPLPDNLPVERVVEPPPCGCGKCGGIRLRKLMAARRSSRRSPPWRSVTMPLLRRSQRRPKRSSRSTRANRTAISMQVLGAKASTLR